MSLAVVGLQNKSHMQTPYVRQARTLERYRKLTLCAPKAHKSSSFVHLASALAWPTIRARQGEIWAVSGTRYVGKDWMKSQGSERSSHHLRIGELRKRASNVGSGVMSVLLEN